MADTYDVSTTAAWIVLFGTCTFFLVLAIGSMGKLTCLPRRVQALCSLNPSRMEHHQQNNNDDDGDGFGENKTNAQTQTTEEEEEAAATDYFLAARDSAGMWSIALSFFASGMGAWVVYGTTEMGATPALSWLGVLGYSGASAFPAVVVCFLGPLIKARSTNRAFSTSDFGRERYGRLMQVAISIISVFYMFIYVVAELTTISNVFLLLTNNGGENYNSKAYGIGVTVVIGFFTLLYTGFAGLPASIVTDRFQGIIMMFLVVLLTIAVSTYEENRITKEEFLEANAWTLEGFMAMCTLIIAITSSEMFNQTTWQRVWAAESVPAMRKGFLTGSLLVFLLMLFFGIMGMIAYANDPVAYDSYDKYAYLAFFDLLLPLPNGWHIVVLVFLTALCASSLDSLQNGLNSIFYRDALRFGCNAQITASVLVLIINAPAVWLASKQFSVISLFMVANLLSSTAVFPTFCGLQTEDKLNGWLPAPTELGAFLGIWTGIAAVCINGRVNGALGFSYFLLDNGALCSVCGKETLISFIVTPLAGGLGTYIFSKLDLILRGDRARKPIFTFAFDREDDDDDNEQPAAAANGDKLASEEDDDAFDTEAGHGKDAVAIEDDVEKPLDVEKDPKENVESFSSNANTSATQSSENTSSRIMTEPEEEEKQAATADSTTVAEA